MLDDELTEAARDAEHGAPYLRRTGRPTQIRIAFGIGAVILLLLAGGLYARQKALTLEAQLVADFRSGQAYLEAGKTALKVANEQHSAAKIAEAQADFLKAKAGFASARRRADGSRLLAIGAHIPGINLYVQPRLAAIYGLSDMGTDLANAASTIGLVDLRLLNPQGSASAGARLLAVLHSSTADIESIRKQLTAAQKVVAAIDPAVLPSGDRTVLKNARATIDSGANAITDFQRLVPVLVDLLGANGTRVYLIEQANAAELRSGGGFLGTVSVLSADHGNLRLLRSGDSYAFDGYTPDQRPFVGNAAYIAPPNVLRGWDSGHSWSFEDSNVAPDFATNAGWAETFAQRRQGIRADGVIAMDFYAVASLLRITGPVSLPEYRVTLTADNFVDEVVRRDLTDPNHKSLLTAAATPIIDRISNLPTEQWPSLLAALNANVIDRHMQASFNSSTVESAIARFGWSPSLNPQKAADFMMETEDNFGGNKANQFVARHYTVTLTQAASTLHHHVVIDLAHSGPPVYTPWYSAYARFYAPANAANLTMRSSPSHEYTALHGSPGSTPNTDVPAGFTMADGWFVINVGAGLSGRYQLVVDYDTPTAGARSGGHAIYWQKQPGTVADKVDVIWQVNGQTFKASGDLGQDRILILTAKGVTLRPARAATAHLPGLTL